VIGTVNILLHTVPSYSIRKEEAARAPTITKLCW